MLKKNINLLTNYFGDQYYEVAKNVAEIILTKSWSEVSVKDVILFGSASRRDANPNDLDMLILHNGIDLQEFDKDPYHKKIDRVSKSDMSPNDKNLRYDACKIFHTLGYNKTSEDDFWGEDSAFNNIMKKVENFGIQPYEDWKPKDRDQFAALFDVHVLSIGLFKANNSYSEARRKEAIEFCRDPTFWYTVLDLGKLYDINTHDFTMSVNDKYLGAANLFLQK